MGVTKIGTFLRKASLLSRGLPTAYFVKEFTL